MPNLSRSFVLKVSFVTSLFISIESPPQRPCVGVLLTGRPSGGAAQLHGQGLCEGEVDAVCERGDDQAAV